MKNWRLFFLIAGLFNLFGGAMGFLDLGRQFRDAGMPAPNYPFSFQLLFIAVIVFGIGLLMVWRDPVANRGIVWLVLLVKIAGFFMTFWALHTHQLPESARAQPFFADLPWAIGCAAFLWQTRGQKTASTP